MDIPRIEKPKKNLDHPSINSHSPAFLLHSNGFSSCLDIEMIAVKSVSYISLKDLMPAASSSSQSSPPQQAAAAVSSPIKSSNSSWNEIPIKNPLVKQAALAYLQPMSSQPPAGEKGLLEKIKDKCCGECGCVSWIYDVAWRNIKEVFWGIREDFNGDYYDDDEDDDKVD
ncbi:hypothetical protein ES332_D02G281000v1 [Gossypium tomentosum]|uniref:Uncharacterized protein n=1 Tax=Gossypium tomentosum TaxID=34277 RepID=A0A5D2M2T1_GOSTO|nr:hypothetical protein ES332_D02G281000v1 [Gossypium tomentosum]